MIEQRKHAYLIMAHNNFYCLEKLLLLLDDSRNDIYLHIDKKIKDFDFDYFQNLCVNANVIFPKKRINVTWEGGLHPRIYTTADYQSLICNTDLFARKFSESTNIAIIDLLFQKLKG